MASQPTMALWNHSTKQIDPEPKIFFALELHPTPFDFPNLLMPYLQTVTISFSSFTNHSYMFDNFITTT
jgi:hypothetical protein